MKPSKVQSNASIIKEQGEALRRNHILIERLREENEMLKNACADIADDPSNKPSWSGAPAWADALVQVENGQWFWVVGHQVPNDNGGWDSDNSDEKEAGRGAVLGDWRDTLERRPDSKLDPVKEWRGPEDGLPPVGAEFEFSRNGKRWVDRVMLFNDGVTCLMECKKYPGNRWHYKCDDPDIICRPLRAEEDKAVDAMLALDCDPVDGMLSRKDFCRQVYRVIKSGDIEIK